MIELILSTTVNHFEDLIPTLDACREIITDPEILKMVPDCQDIKDHFDEQIYDMLAQTVSYRF